MTKKWPLYTGLTLLALGITLKTTTNLTPSPLLIIIAGIAFKILYFSMVIIRNEYKPGFEIVALICGLGIFLSGFFLYNADYITLNTSVFFKVSGIALKTIFILLFIYKTRKTISTTNPAVVKH